MFHFDQFDVKVIKTVPPCKGKIHEAWEETQFEPGMIAICTTSAYMIGIIPKDMCPVDFSISTIKIANVKSLDELKVFSEKIIRNNTLEVYHSLEDIDIHVFS